MYSSLFLVANFNQDKKGVDRDEFEKRSTEDPERELCWNDGDCSTKQATHSLYDLF